MEVEFANNTMSCHNGICLGGLWVESCVVGSFKISASDTAVELADVLSERASIWVASSSQLVVPDMSKLSSVLSKIIWVVGSTIEPS